MRPHPFYQRLKTYRWLANSGVRLEAWIKRQGAWGRIFCFLLLLAIALSPIVLPVYWIGAVVGQSSTAEIVALALIYIGFL
ncbi:MAG: hypothetical protein WA947_14770, partial [Phormidesmis sp.]